MFGLSPIELLVIGGIAVLLFGSRLPEVARSLGKSMNEFKKGVNDLKNEVNIDDRPRTSQQRFSPAEDRDVAVAPKFEPPTSEPTPEVKEEPPGTEPPRDEAHHDEPVA
jgi:sec-independent protein translocase protein TatA